MADWSDVEAAAAAMPIAEPHETRGSRGWRAGPRGKLFAWERPLRQHEVVDHGSEEGPILGVRVADDGEKRALIESDGRVFFTIPHFDGYNAVLVRLDRISRDRLVEVIVESWICVAPAKRVSEFLDAQERPAGPIK